jgi:hypothetical protein
VHFRTSPLFSLEKWLYRAVLLFVVVDKAIFKWKTHSFSHFSSFLVDKMALHCHFYIFTR